jgi:hypothetical protein
VYPYWGFSQSSPRTAASRSLIPGSGYSIVIVFSY